MHAEQKEHLFIWFAAVAEILLENEKLIMITEGCFPQIMAYK